LSGITGIVITALPEMSVVKSDNQKAVSLKFHLGFLVSPHFT
jgi:hypothetical protein